MRIRIASRELKATFALAGVASVSILWATVAGTLFWRSFTGDWSDAPRGARLLSYLDLANENVIGSWFSSMLLALIAWTAVLCFLVDGANGRRDWLRLGWLVIALGFTALSFDELGSIHERLDLPDDWSGQLLWYAPVMVLLPAYMLFFGLSRLRGDRWAFGLALLGTLCFVSIPLQEYFEVAVRNASGTLRPVSEIALEEGTELTGMLLVLAAFVRYCLGALREKGMDAQTIVLPSGTTGAVWVGLFAAGILLSERVSVWLRPDGLSGNPANWFPAFAAFLVACLLWHTPAMRPGMRALVLVPASFVCLGLSMLAGSETPFGEWWLAAIGLGGDQGRTAILAAMFVAGAAIILASGRVSAGTRDPLTGR